MNIWTTKAGNKILIPDITDSHLNNIIKFLERRINKLSLEDFGGWDFVDILDAPPHFIISEYIVYKEKLEEYLSLMKTEQEKRNINKCLIFNHI